MPVSEEFLDKTIQAWQPYYKETLTREDARQMIDTVYNVWEILVRWDMEDKASEAPSKITAK